MSISELSIFALPIAELPVIQSAIQSLIVPYDPESKIGIHFQNENLVMAIKPAGTLSVPSRFANEDDRPVLGRILEDQLQCRLYPVHRLDFEVSGLIIYAKNPKAHTVLNQAFEQRKIHKIYQALTAVNQDSGPHKVVPSVIPQQGDRFEWKAKVLRGKKRSFESAAGKPSLTLAECLDSAVDVKGIHLERKPSHVVTHSDSPASQGQYIRWQLEPVTGRAHQLRFDLARHGFPIVGDTLYGDVSIAAKDQICLSAVKVVIPDSICRELKVIRSE